MWSDLFANMSNTNFFNFSFLPKYLPAFIKGFEYTLLLAVVSVALACSRRRWEASHREDCT